MGAIVNGMAIHGGMIPYGGTFLVFSDYMRGAIRISALSHFPSIWVFTHDSIGLGEDGPTHQPVEQLAALRAIPNLTVIRPADANESIEAWKVAISNRNSPTALLFSRQACPVIDRSKYEKAANLQKGAYILADFGRGIPQIILIASGSEVNLILQAAINLQGEGIRTRVVSFPSWELFEKQSAEYRELVLPSDIKLRLAVEAGIEQGWQKWVGDEGQTICMRGFGGSAPYQTLFEKFGFTVENVTTLARKMIR